jgi:hypothetical protein
MKKRRLKGKKYDFQNIFCIGSNYVPKPSATFSTLDVVPFLPVHALTLSCRDADASTSSQHCTCADRRDARLLCPMVWTALACMNNGSPYSPISRKSNRNSLCLFLYSGHRPVNKSVFKFVFSFQQISKQKTHSGELQSTHQLTSGTPKPPITRTRGVTCFWLCRRACIYTQRTKISLQMQNVQSSSAWDMTLRAQYPVVSRSCTSLTKFIFLKCGVKEWSLEVQFILVMKVE